MMQLLFDELHVFLSRLLVVYSVLLLFTIKVLLLLCAVAGNLACTKVVKPSAATCVFVCLNHELFFFFCHLVFVWCECPWQTSTSCVRQCSSFSGCKQGNVSSDAPRHPIFLLCSLFVHHCTEESLVEFVPSLYAFS